MPEEAAPPPAEQDDAVALLVRAVNHLAPSERDQVFAWLLRVGWRLHSPSPLGFPLGGRVDRAAMYRIFQEAKSSGARVAVASGAASPASSQQVVPVRFPADQHAKLRDWCSQHGFSMATVIRGLVGKFLEEQLAEHN